MEQSNEGNSLNTQERICKDYCLKNDYEVVEIFVEQGESAKTADRTELQKLLTYCADKRNGISAVVIYKLDRLSRNTDDYSQLRLLLKRYGVEIKSTSEHFENTPVGRFMENTMANIAQFDNDVRSERCAGGMKEAMREGRYVWMAPIGYDNVKVGGRSTIAINEKMSDLMRKTFNLISLNTHSLEEIRKMMTIEGLTNRAGKPLSKSYFYTMVKNELYAGWIIKFKEKHKGTFEPLISEELFNQVQRVLKGNGKKNSPHLTDNPDFPLRRFVVNENGKKVTGSWSTGRSQKYPFYRFGGNNSNHKREDFENSFMEYVNEFGFNDANLKRFKELIKENLVKATIGQRKQKDYLIKHLKDLEEKQTSIIKKNFDGIIPDNVLKQQLELIDKDLYETNNALSNIPDSETDFEEVLEFLDDYLKNPSKIWRNAKIDVQLKLQWFQFPSGLSFKNNLFGTVELCSLFNVKSTFLGVDSAKVDPTGLEPATPSVQVRCSTR